MTPERVSHYRIVGRIGGGGMGEVFRATDERLGREVAIKFLRLGIGHSTERQLRLLREAQAASALNHPGIVTVFDVGTQGDRAFLVMELVDGVPFSRLSKLPARDALLLCAHAAEALAASHDRGILHRDIKSENLMRLPDGRIKVLDFGLAKLLAAPSGASSSDIGAGRAQPEPANTDALTTTDSDATADADPTAATIDPTAQTMTSDRLGTSDTIDRPDDPATPDARTQLTRVGDIIGTPAYMAPEQARGEPIDSRSEVFSLGVVLYELLVGRRPFDGTTVDEVLDQIRDRDPLPPSQAMDDAALRPTDELVMRALAKDPTARFPDMRTFATELRRVAARFEPHLRRRRVALVAGAGVLVAGVAGVVAWRALDADEAVPAAPRPTTPDPRLASLVPESARIQRLTFADGCEENPQFSPDGRTLYYNAAVGLEYHLFALDVATGQSTELTRTRGWDLAPAPSPDGKRLAFIRREGTEWKGVFVAPVDDLAAARHVGDGSFRPAWSPDGHVWIGDRGGVTRVDPDTGTVDRKLAAPTPTLAPLLGIELPDRRFVALMTRIDGGATAIGVMIWPATDGPGQWLHEDPALEEVLTLAPEGDAVIVSRLTASRTIELWRVGLDGKPARLPDSAVAARKRLAIARTGRFVWSNCLERTGLAVVEGAGDAVRLAALHGGEWSDIYPATIGTTRQVVFLSDRQSGIEVWRIDRATPGPVQRIATGDIEPVRVGVSADGNWLALAEGVTGLYLAPADGSAPPRLLFAEEGELHPRFTRDGQSILFERRERGTIRVASISVAGGDPTWALPLPSMGPAPSPTDDVVAYLGLSRNEEIVPMLFDPRTGKSREIGGVKVAGKFRTLAWSPDGKRLLLVSTSPILQEIEVATGKTLRVVRARGVDAYSGATYAGDEIIVGRTSWDGDLWTAIPEGG